MATTANFMKNNMIFWLFPIALLALNLIPYKRFFFSLGFIVMIVYFILNRTGRKTSAAKALVEYEFEEEDDSSKYGGKSVEDRKRKLRKEQAKHDRKMSKLIQHSKKDKIRSSKKADNMDSDVNDHDEQLLRLLKK